MKIKEIIKTRKFLDEVIYNIDKKEDDDCWNWLGSVASGGYGVIVFNKDRILIHRFIYILLYGEIPEETEVCHICDNPLCVNPKHLYAGTHAENMNDIRFTKGVGELKGKTNKLMNNYITEKT